MKARAMPLLLALATLVPALAASDQPTAQPPRAERPTYAVGDRWVRSDGVYELLRIEKGHYVFAGGPHRQMHLTRDLALARVQKGQHWIEFDPPPKLAWPLQVGQSGSSWGTWRWQDSSAGRYVRFRWSVAAYEDVSVPAGTLKAFRIDIRLEFTVEAGRRQEPRIAELTHWYAPEARRIVKAVGVHPKGGPWDIMAFEVAAFDRPEPLAIALAPPEAPVRERMTVTGRAHSDAGVTELTVTVNGTQVARQDIRKAPKPELDFSVPITLAPGRNLVLVTALDGAGESRQEARVIVREPATTVATPARPALAPPLSPTPPAVAAKPAIDPEIPPASGQSPAAGALLTIALSSPPDRARVEHEGAVLAGIVSAGKGVARVVVTLNGVEVGRRDQTPPRPAVALNVPLTLREGANTIVVTAADVDGRLSQEVRSVQFDRAMPLTVTFRYPEDKARVTEAGSVVAALVTSSRGVASARVLLNGAEVWTEAGRAPQRSVAVAVPLTLKPGANAVVVSAAEADGTVRQEVRTIIYEAATLTVTSAAPAPATRSQWAVVIGVGNYESAAIPRLRYAVRDAEAVYQVLIGTAGFKKDNVLLLTDRSERKPTLRNVKWALGTFLGRSAGKDDTVVIFFAGHGAPEVDPRGLERDGLAKYLIPSDADPEDLYATALPMDELQTIFGRIEAERVVAFLDACYSGAAGGRTFASKRTRAGSVDDLFLERLTRSKGRAIVTASRPAEVSIELPELGHGIFSYYLVNGLKGAADLNRDGIVSLQELYAYVEEQVTAKSRAVGGNQHPVMKGELEGVLPLAKVPAK